MSIRDRLMLACLVIAAWFGGLAPALSDAIHKKSMEGPPPMSLQNLRTQLAEDTGAMDPELEAQMASLAAMELAEEERVMAMFAVLDEPIQRQAASRVAQLPPLVHAVDPRFFEPVTPSIIRETVGQYGYAVEPLPFAPSMIRPHDLDHRDVLMQILSAVHHRLLSEAEAARVLQGAIELLGHQEKRRAIEAEITASTVDASAN
jgi:hypothetical protein